METNNQILNRTMQQKVVLKFWPIAVLFFLVFIPISFFVTEDYLAGWFLLCSFVFFILTMLFYLRTKNFHLITNMLASLGIPVLSPWLITGGPNEAGFWWSLVYVVWAFLVTDKKSAIYWLSAHFVISFSIVLLSQFHILTIAYSVYELLNVLFAYCLTFVLIFFFDNLREHYFQLSKNREEELNLINIELNAANKELEQFVYIASHDLQEPLRNITNYISLLEENTLGKMDEKSTSYMSIIANSSDKMKTLIRELMNYSRIGRERVIKEVDCKAIMEEVIDELKMEISESSAKINCGELPKIDGDVVEIKYLFLNLLSNAIKFRNPDLTPEIYVECSEKEDEWEFSVKDNGIGIEEIYYAKIFLLFQKLHGESEFPGTGIGLATCKKIVELNGGKIWVKSVKNQGSTFYFSLPKMMKISTEAGEQEKNQ